MDVVVGLDSGTTATKAVTAGTDGRVRDLVSVGYPLSVPAPGRAELDARRLAEAAVTALAAVSAAARERGDRVVGVSLSAAMHGLVPMDGDGRPLGPLVTWADDRAAGFAAALRADGRAAGLHARTGTPVHPMSPLLKLAWLRADDPDRLAAVPRWGGVKELVVSALHGGPQVLDRSCASATGLYGLRAGTWDAEALLVAGVRADQLGEVLPTTAVLPGLRPGVAAAAGLPGDTPVVIGASDGVLANLGIGAVRPQVAAVSLGTSGAMRVVVPQPTVDPAHRLFCYALTDDHWVVGGAVNNGGSVVRWAAQALAGGEAVTEEDADALDARLLEEAAGVPPGSAGLLCLPYLLGERAPWWRSGLRGAYVGLRREHRRPHLVRAAVEGVCQQLALVRDAFSATGLPVTEVRATGGAVASALWVRTLSAALDLPVRVADSPEGTGLGAALLGLHALGALPDLDEATALIGVSDPVEPDPAAADLYRGMRPLVERSTDALTDILATLDELDDTLSENPV
ncbi:gluconate kinase, FGGY family [Geodermatophilus saharensis]|uniref:Gluconate kinase, FGGY family n=1 Tax=Geodermatophilus saharensis TaxID=1137994 RepID=A0A239HM92_9ACTN|nr:gluconokinase [Geodermatophilus saharensis]SNS82241.1 gluconate kinase, FGGY family [Geodermatophilus saharensis]